MRKALAVKELPDDTLTKCQFSMGHECYLNSTCDTSECSISLCKVHQYQPTGLLLQILRRNVTNFPLKAAVLAKSAPKAGLIEYLPKYSALQSVCP